MSVMCDFGESSCRDGGSARLESEHSLDVPAHRHQVPFPFDVPESPQQALSISHHRFDDAEHRFGGLLAQRVQLPASRGLQPMRQREKTIMIRVFQSVKPDRLLGCRLS